MTRGRGFSFPAVVYDGSSFTLSFWLLALSLLNGKLETGKMSIGYWKFERNIEIKRH